MLIDTPSIALAVVVIMLQLTHDTDQEDPTKGVSLTYYGDWCEHPLEQRTFIVDLVCDDRLNPSPSHAYEVSSEVDMMSSHDMISYQQTRSVAYFY